MTIKEVIEATGASVVMGADNVEQIEIVKGFACDLMSDVLTIDTDKVLLITGLCNTQTIRTAEMSDLQAILFVRGKHANEDMLAIAEQNGIVLMESPMSMFRAVANLSARGLASLF